MKSLIRSLQEAAVPADVEHFASLSQESKDKLIKESAAAADFGAISNQAYIAVLDGKSGKVTDLDGIRLPLDMIDPAFLDLVGRSRPVMQEEGSFTFKVKSGVVETVWSTTVQWGDGERVLLVKKDMPPPPGDEGYTVEVNVDEYENVAAIAKALGPAWQKGFSGGSFYYPKTIKAGTKGLLSISAPFTNVATTKETFVSWERLDAMLNAVAEKL